MDISALIYHMHKEKSIDKSNQQIPMYLPCFLNGSPCLHLANQMKLEMLKNQLQQFISCFFQFLFQLPK